MRNRSLLLLLLLLSFLRCFTAFAGVEQLSESEFRELAKELAPKVNLFRDVWAADPKAEFYGGTSRDFLYWLKGKFRETRTKAEAEKIIQSLKQRGSIDIREFIIGGSDVDIISHASTSIDPQRYGVRKIDSHGADYFDPGTETWQNELNQGHIPAEKIRLGADGIIPVPELGDGVKEIYNGKLTIQFADPKIFAQTRYAKEKLNHPILLALRYLRLQAMNYYQEHGAGLPDKNLLLSGMDEKSRAAVKKVIHDSISSRDLNAYLKNEKFKSWLNGTVQKSFLSYTNQTAALEILREFGVDDLHGAYKEVDPINQYVFQQYRDEKAIEANLKKYGVNREKFYQPPSIFFPDGQLYHGTRTEPAFRSIIFQGVLDSEGGSAGAGLYGVSEPHKQFSERWGGSKDRLIRFTVKPDARIVDINSGEGQRILHKFGGDIEAFASGFGIDILRYPYNGTDAYVVKNSGALGQAQGVYRELLHFDDLMERLRKSKSPEERIGLIKLNSLSREDTDLVHKEFPKLSQEVLDWLLARKDPGSEAALDHSAMLNLAKKEMYRLAKSNDPATLEKLAKAARPLSLEVVKTLLDAPDELLTKLSEELGADIKDKSHRIFRENFGALFSEPHSVRLAPLLDKYLEYADHSQRYYFVPTFALPHMKALEPQMLTMLRKGEPNIYDSFARDIFTGPAALNYPKGFETWLKSSKMSSNHKYYVEKLLQAPFLKENDAYLKLVVEDLTKLYPDKLAHFFYDLPAEKRQSLLPLAMEKLSENQQAYFLNQMFVRQGQGAFARMEDLSPWEKKFIWDIWLKAPPSTQAQFTPLILPQIKELPPAQRFEHYRRLLTNTDISNELNTFFYFFSLPASDRPPELWSLIQSYLKQKKYLANLRQYSDFTPGSPGREILEAMSAENNSLLQENLKNLSLPRDQKLLLQFLDKPDTISQSPYMRAEIVRGALASPEAAASEEVALSILRQSKHLDDLGMDRLLAMDHTKDWHKAQLLYVEKAYDWHPNPSQLAAINTPEGRARILAVITENKYDWQKKMYLNRHFPPDGKPVKGLKGFVIDCAAGFAKLR